MLGRRDQTTSAKLVVGQILSAAHLGKGSFSPSGVAPQPGDPYLLELVPAQGALGGTSSGWCWQRWDPLHQPPLPGRCKIVEPDQKEENPHHSFIIHYRSVPLGPTQSHVPPAPRGPFGLSRTSPRVWDHAYKT